MTRGLGRRRNRDSEPQRTRRLRAKIRETAERVALDVGPETMAKVYGVLLEVLR